MGNISAQKKARIDELHETGMKPVAIASNVGLQIDSVKTYLNNEYDTGFKIGVSERSAAPAPRTSRTIRNRPGQAFKEFQQRDYADFVERWQQNPNVAAHAEALDRNEEEITWLVRWLRGKGVALKKVSRSPVCDFDELQKIAKAAK